MALFTRVSPTGTAARPVRSGGPTPAAAVGIPSNPVSPVAALAAAVRRPALG